MEQLAIHFPDLEIYSWKDLIRDSFALTAEQEASLEKVCNKRSADIQQIFKQIAQHTHLGGQMQGKIVKNSNGTHTAWVYLLPLSNTAHVEPQMLRIVCCDANCGDWDWGCNG